MRRATSIDDILAAPLDAYFAVQSFVVWFQRGLAGAFAFDRLHPLDQPVLVRLLVTPVLAPGYDLFCDLGAVEVLDDRAFGVLTSFLETHPHLVADLKRFAFVRPPGLAGAGLAGLFYERVQPIVQAGLFTNRSEALDWLGHREGARERREIEEVIATVHSISPTLQALRTFLVQEVASATLESAAKALAISNRTLQRELAMAKTSFRAELGLARTRAAESLLAATDEKIETIAHRIGYASVPAFTTAFTRSVGETPSEFRRRRAPGARS